LETVGDTDRCSAFLSRDNSSVVLANELRHLDKSFDHYFRILLSRFAIGVHNGISVLSAILLELRPERRIKLQDSLTAPCFHRDLGSMWEFHLGILQLGVYLGHGLPCCGHGVANSTRLRALAGSRLSS